MSYKSFKYLVLAAPFFLAACGEGYEQVRTTEYFPYGNQRTAGSAIAYVQSNILPERALNLGHISGQQKHGGEISAPAKVLEALDEDFEKLFEEKQKK